MLDNEVTVYRKNLKESIFSCMELSGQSYEQVAAMPIQRFYDYLKWKSDLEDEKQKLIKDHVGGN